MSRDGAVLRVWVLLVCCCTSTFADVAQATQSFDADVCFDHQMILVQKIFNTEPSGAAPADRVRAAQQEVVAVCGSPKMIVPNQSPSLWLLNRLLTFSQQRVPQVDVLVLIEAIVAVAQRLLDQLTDSDTYHSIDHSIDHSTATNVTVDQLLGAVSHVQVQSPMLLYLSPRMWWIRADSANSSTMCSAARTLSYDVSWLALSWFLLMVRLVYQSTPVSLPSNKQRMVTSVTIATITSFLYAVIESTCMLSDNVSSCAVESRQRFNFLWPAMVLLLFGLIQSSQVSRVDFKTNAFSRKFTAARKPIETWEQGRMLASAGTDVVGPDTTSPHAPLEVPNKFQDFHIFFQVGVACTCVALIMWLVTC